MRDRQHGDSREHIWFGLALVVVGTLFLLDRLGIIYVERYWDYWGVLPIVFGVARILVWRSARSVASGVSWIFFGLWFLTSANEWFGLDWGTSWPMVFVSIGASMVVRSLLEPVFQRRAANQINPGGPHHA